MVAAGCSNKEIAGQCGISAQTIKHHLTRMFEKLGVSNRLELAVIATERGLVQAVDSEPPRQPERIEEERPAIPSRRLTPRCERPDPFGTRPAFEIVDLGKFERRTLER